MNENEVLARVRLAASEDPFTGTEQTTKDFFEKVRLRFIERGPSDTVTTERRYDNQTSFSIKQHFENIFAEIQKFRVSLSTIVASKPTEVREKEVACMFIV